MKIDKRSKFYKKVKSAKKYCQDNRGALWFAIIAGFFAAVLFVNHFVKPKMTLPKPIGQTIMAEKVTEVKAETRPFCNDAINCIRDVGEQLEMPNEDIMKMIRIARCESGFDQYAKNPYSTAKGIFQFIDGTWRSNCLKDGNVYDFADNIKCAWKVYQKQGSRPWNASKSCWNK